MTAAKSTAEGERTAEQQLLAWYGGGCCLLFNRATTLRRPPPTGCRAPIRSFWTDWWRCCAEKTCLVRRLVPKVQSSRACVLTRSAPAVQAQFAALESLLEVGGSPGASARRLCTD